MTDANRSSVAPLGLRLLALCVDLSVWFIVSVVPLAFGRIAPRIALSSFALALLVVTLLRPGKRLLGLRLEGTAWRAWMRELVRAAQVAIVLCAFLYQLLGASTRLALPIWTLLELAVLGFAVVALLRGEPLLHDRLWGTRVSGGAEHPWIDLGMRRCAGLLLDLGALWGLSQLIVRGLAAMRLQVPFEGVGVGLLLLAGGFHRRLPGRIALGIAPSSLALGKGAFREVLRLATGALCAYAVLYAPLGLLMPHHMALLAVLLSHPQELRVHPDLQVTTLLLGAGILLLTVTAGLLRSSAQRLLHDRLFKTQVQLELEPTSPGGRLLAAGGALLLLGAGLFAFF